VSDRIEIRDLRVTGTHGVLPEERDRAQPFSVDIVAWVDMEAAQQSDDLADTVDYGALAQAAAHGPQQLELLGALDALGHDLDAQVAFYRDCPGPSGDRRGPRARPCVPFGPPRGGAP